MAKSYIITTIISLIVVGLYVIALLTGGIMLQVQNDAPILLTEDVQVSSLYNSLNDSISDVSTNSQAAYESFSNSSIITSGVTPFLSAVGGMWKLIVNAPVQIISATFIFITTTIFGSPVIGTLFLGAVGSIILLIIISGVVKFVSRGEGD